MHLSVVIVVILFLFFNVITLYSEVITLDLNWQAYAGCVKKLVSARVIAF